MEGVAGQRYAIFPVHGYGSGDAGMGVSVGTNGVSVYEHADGYMPPLLVWESSTPITDWTHVAIVYRNKQPSLYINGNWVKDGQVSQKNNVYAGLQFPGGHYGGTGGEQMDEVRVWKYARTEQQIRDNRQGEIPGTTPGLAGYWPMNEGSGTVLHDISGNGRDIDLSSAGYNNSNWVSGRYTVSNQEDLYRYAFNSKERDQDIGEDNYDYGFRIHDARLGRFLSVDPLTAGYPMLTPYQYASNRPIDGVDQDGLEWAPAGPNKGIARDGTAVQLRPDLDKSRLLTSEQVIRNQVYKSVLKNDYNGAILSVIKFYHLLDRAGVKQENFDILINKIGEGGVMVTSGEIGKGEKQIIIISKNDINTDNDLSWAFLVRGIFHELTHVKQKTQENPILDHNEREFLAYSAQLLEKGLPEHVEGAWGDLNSFINRTKDYYNQLSVEKQKNYEDLYKRVTSLSNEKVDKVTSEKKS